MDMSNIINDSLKYINQETKTGIMHTYDIYNSFVARLNYKEIQLRKKRLLSFEEINNNKLFSLKLTARYLRKEEYLINKEMSKYLSGLKQCKQP